MGYYQEALEESASTFIHFIGQIQFLVLVGLRSLFPWLHRSLCSCPYMEAESISHFKSRLILFFFFFFLVFLGPHPQHTEVPRLGVKSEPQLPTYITATASRDLSRICDLHHSSWQCWILNPLSEARDRTCILTDTSRVHYH